MLNSRGSDLVSGIAIKMDRAQRLMTIAATVSLLGHAYVAFMLTFVPPTPKHRKPTEPLEVVLVNQKTQRAPDKAEVLAQVDLDGGGNTDAKLRAKTPLPSSGDNVLPELEQTLQQQQRLEAQAQDLMMRLKSDHSLSAQENTGKRQDERAGRDAQDKKLSTANLATMAAQIAKEHQEYQEKPRKNYVGARAKQASVAFWMDSWTRKVEKVGTLAFPQDRHGKKIYGTLRIAVEIGMDGNILNKSIEVSSGNPQLDQAALMILERATPFPRLPADMLDSVGKPATVLAFSRRFIFEKNTGTFETKSGSD